MRVAITGSIGSGKTTVCTMLSRRGYPVIIADEVNGELLRDPKIQKHIMRMLGLENFSRPAVAYAIFANESAREQLDQYIHPMIMERIEAFLRRHSQEIAFAEIPLLFETGLDREFDYTVTVMTETKIADQRLEENRGINTHEARRRRLQQLAQDDKARRSNYVITNNGDLTALSAQVEQLLEKLKEKEAEREG